MMSAEPTFRPHAIILDGGILKSCTIIDANGPRPDYTGIGNYHFSVDLVEEDGGRIGLWSGFDYTTAIREAEGARIDFGITEPVRDLVVGGCE